MTKAATRHSCLPRLALEFLAPFVTVPARPWEERIVISSMALKQAAANLYHKSLQTREPGSINAARPSRSDLLKTRVLAKFRIGDDPLGIGRGTSKRAY